MRSSDVVVLTVGGLVFSSDPRIGVVQLPRPWQNMGVWALRQVAACHRRCGARAGHFRYFVIFSI